MRPNPTPLIALCALLFALAARPSRAAGLDLPVWTPGSPVHAPCYRGDALEVRLAPAAARAVLPRGAGATRARPVGRLGVSSIDALTATLGFTAFEPEFRGETPPDANDPFDFTAFHLVHLGAGSDLATALARLRALPEVLSADPIAILPVSTALPNDSLTFATWWLYKNQPFRTDIRAPEAWQVESGDTSIVVGVIDTGVIPYHPDLGGRAGERGQMWINWAERAGVPGVDDDGNGYVDDYGGWDFVAVGSGAAPGEDAQDEDNDPNDWGGHGTAVAGIIGAIPGNGIGLAGIVPKVRLMPLRIGWLTSGSLPPAGQVDMSYAAAAIRYATRNGCTVVNCSWQSINQGGLDVAVSAATRAGMVIVNASGNDGTLFTYLGQREDVIAVTATDSSDVIWNRAVTGSWVDLAAGGVSITSTMFQRLSQTDSLVGRTPAYRGFMNGTSFAAPQVTGAVALLQAHRRAQGLPPLIPAGVLARLRETTDDISSVQLSSTTGYGTGRLNLFKLLTDPPHSLAVRAHARSVGPGVVIPYNTGRTLVVYAMSDRSLVAYDGATSDTVWVRPLPGPPTGQLAAAEFGAPTGVLIVGATTNGQVYAFHDDGHPALGWPILAQPGMNMSAGVVLADVTGDGLPEILAGGTLISGSKLWAWGASGAVLTGFPFDVGNPGMSLLAAADLDGAPGAEIAFTDGLGAVRVVNGSAVELAGFPTPPLNSPRAPVIARLGGGGTPPSLVLASASLLTAYAPDGSTRWSVPLAGSPVQDPALADLDGDGVDEIVLAMAGPNAIVVRDSSGAPFTGRSGWPAMLPASPVGPPVLGPLGSATGPCVAVFQSGALSVLDDNAHLLGTFPKPGGAGQFPSLGEFDADGATEIAAGISNADSNAYIYDAGAGTWSLPRMAWPTPRGDAARKASHALGAPAPVVIDRIRPARVADLEAHALTTTSALVSWTGTGDDSLTGTPAAVVLRLAPYPLDEQNFNTGVLVPALPPSAPGAANSVTVPFLPEGSSTWFALRVVDRAGNRSAVSNSDSASLPGLPPAGITDLRALSVAESTVVLAWTASGDDGRVGRPLFYRVAATPNTLDSASFEGAPVQIVRPAFVDAGGGETLAVHALTPGRRWRFAVRAVDRARTTAVLSNVVEAITPVGGALAGRAGMALAPRPMPATGDVTVDWQGDAGATGPQWLLVYDLTGRELRRIALGGEPGGSYNWDGRDGASRLLPAGLYFLRLLSGARHADSRVVFVR